MKQMRKKLLLVGILAVTLSTISATQYVRADLGFSYEIVHPSDADIRYIGSDNAGDSFRVLRGNNAGNGQNDSSSVELYFGKWAIGQEKVYTAAFGIVNEEEFDVDITAITVSGHTPGANLEIWLHGNEDDEATAAPALLMYNTDGTAPGGTWILAAGNQDPEDMSHDGTNQITTDWCPNDSQVRVATGTTDVAVNETADYVWVQIVLTVPDGAAIDDFEGTIEFTFESDTEL
jgi:hypothetical protein